MEICDSMNQILKPSPENRSAKWCAWPIQPVTIVRHGSTWLEWSPAWNMQLCFFSNTYQVASITEVKAFQRASASSPACVNFAVSLSTSSTDSHHRFYTFFLPLLLLCLMHRHILQEKHAAGKKKEAEPLERLIFPFSGCIVLHLILPFKSKDTAGEFDGVSWRCVSPKTALLVRKLSHSVCSVWPESLDLCASVCGGPLFSLIREWVEQNSVEGWVEGPFCWSGWHSYPIITSSGCFPVPKQRMD